MVDIERIHLEDMKVEIPSCSAIDSDNPLEYVAKYKFRFSTITTAMVAAFFA